ncbi:prion-inhibition and propagation-domain-containing protein [Fusarium redolens]|uniref:Prion-inhibition and propagation-domain-containing protein n=1 Tax=Fusarium redolens TaxID=48865 RepID=A0A9P9FZ01_FUSRE|nr:prion-inhibition and propagation-domain-containing protein [Fusarium redolens]KAH7222611.1 prion-inhibition and propagation-domain-containing protein [Fusarium redolens]
MLDPGSIIALTQITYEGAKRAVDLVLTAIHFPKECEELFVQLKLEQFRLQCWGRSAGLEQGKLIEALHPIFPEIRNALDCISALFQDLNKLQAKFGIVSTTVEDVGQRQKELAYKWNEELHKQGLALSGKQGDDGAPSLISKEQKTFFPVGTFKVNLPARLRWALGNKSKFRDCVAELEKYTNKLNQLLPERQSLQYKQDWTRVNIIIVGKADDENTVSLLRHALEGSPTMEASLRGLVDRKSVAAAPSTTNFLRGNPQLDKSAFAMPMGAQNKERFIATRKTTGEQVLFEKKSWDDERSMANRSKLQMRLSRLVAMLRPGRSNYLLKAIGFAEDEVAKCWWIVYEIPSSVANAGGNHVITLHERFGRQFFYMAPLEVRAKLAFALATAYSELFSSGWVHKAISSHSIVYFGPHTGPISPSVVGFEFSRQDTEESNVDAAKTPAQVERSVYRHPDYIGSEAKRYMTQYDIYSFGLVLIEIAFWQPLKDVCPYAKGDAFGKEEAKSVQKWAVQVAETQFAFRVGTVYANVVSWCLKNGARVSKDQEDWHPALAFNDNVVVPLSGA